MNFMRRHSSSRRGERSAAMFALAGMLVHVAAAASTYCAHTSAEFASALVEVSTGGIANGQDNVIHLAGGTLVTAVKPFGFSTADGHSLTIDGGYDNACALQDPTPGLSALDGGNATQVLNVQTNGTIDIRNITIQNASYNGSAGAGAQFYLIGTAVLNFESNQVINNHTTFAAAGIEVFGPATDAGVAYIRGNLFAGNSAPAAAALATSLGNASTIYLTNNTMAGNTSTNIDAMTTALGGGTAGGYVSNNISYGNTDAHDFYLYSFETFEFDYNDFHSVQGAKKPGSTGNVDVDPNFVGGGDYHLQLASALINAGTVTPAGGLPAADLEGNPRTFAGQVDLGAYESGDRIFANGFELP